MSGLKLLIIAARVAALVPLAVLGAAATCEEAPDGGANVTPAITATPPGATPSGAFRTEPAPIDSLDVLVRESFPPQYALVVKSGLPSGCHEFDNYDVQRSGASITVRVTNRLPAGTGIACTAIYGTHEERIDLGNDFTPGVTYTVDVNDRSTSFTAQ